MLASTMQRSLSLLPRSARFLSTGRKPKPMKVKKNEARRKVEEKPKQDSLAELKQQEELMEQQQTFPPAPQPETFGGAMKQSFLWGIGMALAFTTIGIIFGGAEPLPMDEMNIYEASSVHVEEEDDV